MSVPLELAEPWIVDQVRARLANFLVLFPGHTAFNVHDIAYEDWRGLAEATDLHVERTARRRGR